MLVEAILGDLEARYPQLESCRSCILAGFELLRDVFSKEHKWLVAGNGGSASDADHIAGELLKVFECPEKLENSQLPLDLSLHLQHALPVIPLANLHGIYSAFSNDCEPDWAFAQLVWGLGQSQDGLWALSTSGNSRNILNAIRVARAKRMKVLGLSGASGGAMKALCDVCICVPEVQTFKIQELHLPIYHALCRMLEVHFFA